MKALLLALALVAFVASAPGAEPQAPAAQAGASSPLPPAAQRAGNLPLRNVPCSYSPCGKRVSPQDGAIGQIKPNGQTPRDADGHPDLTGNWGAGFPNPIEIRSTERDRSASPRTTRLSWAPS